MLKDGCRLADFSLFDQPTLRLRLSGPRLLSRRARINPAVTPRTSCPPRRRPKSEVAVQTGLHALGSGLQRMTIALVLTVFLALLAYAGLVFVIVTVQAVQAFGQ